MATAPGRGSSEGASPTASVTALLRVPGGTEVSGFGTEGINVLKGLPKSTSRQQNPHSRIGASALSIHGTRERVHSQAFTICSRPRFISAASCRLEPRFHRNIDICSHPPRVQKRTPFTETQKECHNTERHNTYNTWLSRVDVYPYCIVLRSCRVAAMHCTTFPFDISDF